MAQRCALCAHARRDEIDERLRGPHKTVEIARDLGVTRFSVMRHRDNHLGTKRQQTARNGKKSPREGDDSDDIEEVVRTEDESPPPQDLPGQQTAFLTAYAASCDIKQGLKAAGITRAQLRRWQEHDESFLQRFHQAEVEAIESLEYEARIRAIAGSKLVRRVFRHGLLYEEIHEWRPSDAMMTKLLQAAKPEKYGERLTVTQTTVVKAIDQEAWSSV